MALATALRSMIAALILAGPPPGLTLRHLAYHGHDGTYYVHIPATPRGAAVLVLHGGLGNGRAMARLTRFSEAADANGFIAVYPNADGNWNDGRETTTRDWADAGFLRAVAADLEAKDHVDPKRLFVTGISNGGIMTLALACDASDAFAAFAAVAGNMAQALQPNCKPSRPVPLMMFNGTADTFVPWKGGEVRHNRLMGAGGHVISTQATFDFWRQADGCTGAGDSTAMPDVANDGTTVTRHRYDACANGTALVLYEIKGGGHAWPGAPGRSRFHITGTTTHDIDATPLIVEFFKRFGL